VIEVFAPDNGTHSYTRIRRRASPPNIQTGRLSARRSRCPPRRADPIEGLSVFVRNQQPTGHRSATSESLSRSRYLTNVSEQTTSPRMAASLVAYHRPRSVADRDGVCVPFLNRQSIMRYSLRCYWCRSSGPERATNHSHPSLCQRPTRLAAGRGQLDLPRNASLLASS